MKNVFSVSFVLSCAVLLLVPNCVHPVTAIEGAHCSSSTSEGKCLPITKCPAAIKSIRLTGRPGFKRCGFDDRIEIVCCPVEKMEMKEVTTEASTTSSTTTTSKTELRNPSVRRSLQACHEYSKAVENRVTYQILGGESAQLGEFPHMAAIGFKVPDEEEMSWRCGASLISEEYALTAAHCFVVRDSATAVKVRMGVVNIKDELTVPKDYDILNVTLHPQYNRRTKHNDIALMKVSPVKMDNFIAPACLYQVSDDPQTVVVSGWGVLEPAGSSSDILQKATLESVSVKECNFNHTSILLGKPITNMQICAKSADGKKDTCQGDSGGPLQTELVRGTGFYSIVGITSYGRSCGGTVPSVYTRVYSYLDWIENIVWPT